MECLNCGATVQAEWDHCPKCGANLKTKKYSRSDDPTDEVKKLRKDVDAIKQFLEEEPEEEVNPNEPTNPKPKRRRPTFG